MRKPIIKHTSLKDMKTTVSSVTSGEKGHASLRTAPGSLGIGSMERSDLLEAVLHTVQEAILVFRPVYDTEEGEIIDFTYCVINEMAVKMLPPHLHNTQLLGENLLTWFPSLKTEGIFECYVSVIKTGEPVQFVSHYHHEGFDNWFSQTVRKFRDGVIVCISDVTAERRSQFKPVGRELLESREFIERLTQTLPDMVYVYDVTTNRNVFSNRSVLDILGYENADEDLRANIYARLAHPEDQAKFEELMKKLVESSDSEIVHNEFRMKHADGDYRWLVSRSTVFKRDENGRAVQIIGILQDNTAGKKMKAELRERNEQLLDAQQLTRMGNWIFNTVTGQSNWSDQVYALFGAERKEGESTFDVLDRHVFPEDIVKIRELAGRAITQGIPYQSQYRITRADGQFRVIATMARPDHDKEGNLVLKGICQDITERWEAEEKLRRSEALLAEAQRMANLGSWEWNVGANEVLWTDELYRVFGYVPGSVKVTFEKYLEHIHPEDHDWVQNAVKGELSEEGTHSRQYRIVRPDGSIRTLLSSSRTIMNSAGDPERMVGICLDITDRMEAEEELKRKTIAIEAEKEINKKKDEFISIASHELKTPLTSLKAYVQLLEAIHSEDSNDKAKVFLSKTGVYIRRLEGLISDLLDVSKIEAGKLQFQEEVMRIDELLEESIENNRLTLTRHTIKFTNDATCYVKVDRQRIDQVLSNLISNAAKYSPKADTIEVNASADDDWVMISVRDFGMGIGKADLEKIFDRFYRVETKVGNITGLGLGLYIASEIVNRHDGKMWVESEPGKGSVFRFSLPVLKQ